MDDKFKSNSVPTNYFKDLIKTVAFSLIITFIILLASALLLCFTDFPEKYALPSAIAATIVGVFSGCSMAARKNPFNRWVSSLLTAFIYSVVAYIISCIVGGKIRFTKNTALFLAIALITGAIACILSSREKRPGKFGTGSSNLDRFKKKRFPKSYNLGKSGR